jgi:nitrogen fixation/metabolism regulation signal transduction histidine kinase
MPYSKLFKKLENPFSFPVKMSIRTKLVFALVFLVVISLATVMYFSLKIVNVQFEKVSQERVSSAIKAISMELNLEEKDALQKLVQTAKIVELKRKMLLKEDGEQIDYAGLALQLNDIKKSTGLDLLEISDKQGVILASGHEPGRVGLMVNSDPLVRSSLRGKMQSAIVVEKLLTGSYLAIKVSVPIEQRGEIIGSMTGGYLINRRFLDRFRQLSSAHVILLRPDAAAISSLPESTDFDDTGLKLDPSYAKRALVLKESHYESLNIGGENYLAGNKPLISQGKILGTMVVMVSNQVIDQTFSELRKAFISLSTIAILLAILISYLIALRITRPIESLVEGAVAIAGGNFDHKIPQTGKDEIAMLINAFNYMTHELQENQKKLVTAIRMAEWQEVARRIAHEIKNPLTPIALSIESLQRSYRDKDENLDEIFHESTQTILEEVHNLQRIVDEFSAFARLPRLRKEWMDLIELLESTVSLYETLRENVHIKLIYENEIPQVYADTEQLRRAFSNLIKNAMDAMPEGGDLTIRLQTEMTSDKKYILLEFVDTGTGISEENLSKLFIPYYSTKKKGTGLGLSIVEKIVSEHRGTIRAESHIGVGSRFIIRLPVEEMEEADTVHEQSVS